MTTTDNSEQNSSLTIALIVRFFGSTPQVSNTSGDAYINDPEGHGIMSPLYTVLSKNGVEPGSDFGSGNKPTKENPLTIFLDTNKNKGDTEGCLLDIQIVESAADGYNNAWKLELSDGDGHVQPLDDAKWTAQDSAKHPADQDLRCTMAIAGRPASSPEHPSSDETLEVVLSIFRTGQNAIHVDVPMKIIYRERITPQSLVTQVSR